MPKILSARMHYQHRNIRADTVVVWMHGTLQSACFLWGRMRLDGITRLLSYTFLLVMSGERGSHEPRFFPETVLCHFRCVLNGIRSYRILLEMRVKCLMACQSASDGCSSCQIYPSELFLHKTLGYLSSLRSWLTKCKHQQLHQTV